MIMESDESLPGIVFDCDKAGNPISLEAQRVEEIDPQHACCGWDRHLTTACPGFYLGATIVGCAGGLPVSASEIGSDSSNDAR